MMVGDNTGGAPFLELVFLRGISLLNLLLREASKRTLSYPFGFHLVHGRDWILILIQKGPPPG